MQVPDRFPDEFNFIVQNEFCNPWTDWLLFRYEDPETGFPYVEPVSWISPEKNMADLLTQCGFFESKSQARKAGWLEIPDGFTDLRIGKKKRRITIFKPTKANL